MKIPETGTLVRIFIGESDLYNGVPLYESIVKYARKINIAGATVIRGIMGFGATSRIHSSKILRLSEDLPIVIELVDSGEKIKKLMPFLDEHVKEGLITMEELKVIKYRHSDKKGGLV